jgi:hypothetical protein
MQKCLVRVQVCGLSLMPLSALEDVVQDGHHHLKAVCFVVFLQCNKQLY